MRKETAIQKYCTIEGGRVVVDGEELLVCEPQLAFSEFAKSAFLHLGVAYPKFYKMDALSKLAFLGAEYILQGENKEDIALLLSSRSGSLDTDIKHQASIQDAEHFYPRPATFVYTLPNICAGEICIRHGLQTEHAFFMDEEFPQETVFAYADYLLQSGKAKNVLCGWVEYAEKGYNTSLYIL